MVPMTDPLFTVADQVVLVSGGSRGIGKGLAGAFAQRGAKVVLLSRDVDVLQQAAAELSAEAVHPVTTVVCDVAVPEQITIAVDAVLTQHGRIDTLLNVAGVNRRKKLETLTPEDYRFVMDINLDGAFWMAHRVGCQMLTQGSGAIINIDSLNTAAPLKAVAPYAMSKAGVQMMTRSMALEWSDRGVRVNALAPGFILTDLTEKLWSDPRMQAWGQVNTPMRRLGTPADLIGTAIFLASPASAFLTGQVIYVDGGFTAGVAWPIPL
jgi:gluconate 5-dehydrogenase